MPELPEVETSCRGIAPYCVGAEIKQLLVRQPRLRWPLDPELESQIKGEVILNVARRGKYILLQMADAALMIHLGMSGSLRVLSRFEPPQKHDHVDLVLHDGTIIRFTDPRRFGSIILNNQGDNHPLLHRLGVEPLSEAFSDEYFYLQCQRRKAPIKAVIMNSQIVVGVGNIYAQESLFQAGVDPRRPSNKIAPARLKRLRAAIVGILQDAILAGGSSLKDFTSANGKPGYFQQTLLVYGRSGQACHQCGKVLTQKIIAQRNTVFCGRCQR